MQAQIEENQNIEEKPQSSSSSHNTQEKEKAYCDKELIAFRKIKMVKMILSKQKKVKPVWQKILEDTAVRLGTIMTVGSRFLHFYLVKCRQQKQKEYLSPLNFRNLFSALCTFTVGKEKISKRKTYPCLNQQWVEKFLQNTKLDQHITLKADGLENALTFQMNLYQTHFIRYHTQEAIQAHYRWYLREKYDLTKKQAAWFVESYWPKSKEEQKRKEKAKKQEEEDSDSDQEPEEIKKTKERLKITLQQEIVRFQQLTSTSKHKVKLDEWIDFHFELLESMESLEKEKQISLNKLDYQVKKWSMCPQINKTRQFVRLDVSTLNALKNASDFREEMKEIEVKDLSDIFCVPLHRLLSLGPNSKWDWGASLMTDGVQLCLELEKTVHRWKTFYEQEEHQDWMQRIFEKEELKMKYEEQQQMILHHMTPEKKIEFEKKTKVQQKSIKKKIKKEINSDEESWIDGRCTKEVLPVLDQETIQIYPEDTKLLDHSHGLFRMSCLKNLPADFLQKFSRIYAIDPGHSNLLSCVRLDPNTSFQADLANPEEKKDWQWEKKNFVLSKGHYYESIGNRPFQRWMKQHKSVERATQKLNECTENTDPQFVKRLQDELKIRQQLQQFEQAASQSSLKTTNLQTILKSASYFISSFSLLHSFYGSKNMSRREFNRFQKKQLMLEDLLKQFAPEEKDRDKTLLFLGSARFAVSMKGGQASPVRSLVQHLARYVRVVLVDEFNTTRMCGRLNCCDAEIYSLQLQPSEVYAKKSHHSVQCDLKYKEVKKSCEDFPFTPMMDFQYTHHLPKRLANRLLKLKDKFGWEEERYQKVLHRSFASSIHGLKQCRHCKTFYNRDRSAAENIGRKALDLCVFGRVRAPLDRQLYQTCLEKQQERATLKKQDLQEIKLSRNQKRKIEEVVIYVESEPLEKAEKIVLKKRKTINSNLA